MTQATSDLKCQSGLSAAACAAGSSSMKTTAVMESTANTATGDQVDVVDSMQEDNLAPDLVSIKNRRRGRPPKNSNTDLSYSPPEKKLRMPQVDVGGNPHQQSEIGSTGKYSIATNVIHNDFSLAAI